MTHDRLTEGGTEYVYEIVRGHLSDTRPRRNGVAALLDVRCTPDDGRLRMLTWFRADAFRANDLGAEAHPQDADHPNDSAGSQAPGRAGADAVAAEAEPGAAEDMSMAADSENDFGTPDDKDDLRDLLAQLDPCGGSGD